MSRHLGLIIGVNQYQDRTFRPLTCAESDARAIAQWLVNAKGGKWSAPDVQLVQGQHATHELVEALLTQICINKAETDDVILIYFAGHAFLDMKSGEGYLALTNSNYQDPSSSLSLTMLAQQILARSPAAQIVCVLDCFQTGQLWQMRRTSPYDSKPVLGPTILKLVQQRANRLFLCSCRGNENAQEASERGLGLFAHRMILGLCGPAQDASTGTTTLAGLHTYLFQALGEQQRPQLFGKQQPPLVLVGEIPATIGTARPTTGALGPSGLNLPNTPMGAQSPEADLYATVAAPPRQAQAATTGHIFTSALDQHRQQQQQQLLEQARQRVQTQQYSEALTIIEQALRINPTDQAALTLKAQTLGTMGNFAEAMAVVDQLGQADPRNPVAWSMRAVVLSNTGQHQAALTAIERSLELDPKNPESYAIKNTILSQMAAGQNLRSGTTSGLLDNPTYTPPPHRADTFAITAGLHVAGLVIGIAGAVLPILMPRLPSLFGQACMSIGLAVLCVAAVRGAFRGGITRLFFTLFMSLLAGGILGAAYKLGYTRALLMLQNHPELAVPLLFFVLWLVAAAIFPLLLALIGWISGLASKRRGNARLAGMA